MVVYVVLLAMVAGFLALRLYMVLGRRTGHEQPMPRPTEDRLPAPPVLRPAEPTPEIREMSIRMIEGGAETGLRAISGADSSFDLAQFIQGAKSAYRMILEAFWAGDDEKLSWLVSDDVHAAFTEATRQRADAGHVVDNRLVSIERAIVTDASLQGRVARITVRFDADIAAVTRDVDGNVVAGSLSDAVQTHDVWTFARTLRSDDPNWKLVETDAD